MSGSVQTAPEETNPWFILLSVFPYPGVYPSYSRLYMGYGLICEPRQEEFLDGGELWNWEQGDEETDPSITLFSLLAWGYHFPHQPVR